MILIRKIFKALRLIPVWIICRLFRIDKKKIVVSNYRGRGYGDNAKYIVESLLRSDNDIKIIWLVLNDKEASSLPKDVIPCRMHSVASIYHLSTAKIWIDNCRKGVILFKRKSQFYMQTWHGFALKQIEKDVEDKLGKTYVRDAKKDSKLIDCIISDSKFMTQIYKSSFWYNGDVLELGSPRNDIIINRQQDLADRVYKHFNISNDKKLILYAPTFRADGSNSAYALDFQRVKRSCEERFGGTFSVLVRLHPNIINNSEQMYFDGINIINASFYPDMQELLSVSSVVISDYSSLMFDFALSMKPCFQFATDIDAYKQDRNFYFEIDKLPFVLAKDNEEMEKEILFFNEDAYKARLSEFYDSVGMIMNGFASSKCSDIILEKMLE